MAMKEAEACIHGTIKEHNTGNNADGVALCSIRVRQAQRLFCMDLGTSRYVSTCAGLRVEARVDGGVDGGWWSGWWWD